MEARYVINIMKSYGGGNYNISRNCSISLNVIRHVHGKRGNSVISEKLDREYVMM